MDRTPVILSGVRTATGNFGGALSNINCPELGALCAKEAMKRANQQALYDQQKNEL